MRRIAFRGFTLIELLATITIIGILATFAITGVSNAAKRGRDARRKADIRRMYNAIEAYHQDTGSVPINRSPGQGYYNSNSDFLQEVIDGGQVNSITRSPNAGQFSYAYYDYGAGSAPGAILATTLEIEKPSTGYTGTCRPFAPNTNWCDQSSNKWFCMCFNY